MIIIFHGPRKIHVEKVAGKIMNRPVFIRSENHPYHVTSRTSDQEFFPLPLNVVWEMMTKELFLLQRTHHLAVHAFVLMGNHFHLLCHTPQGNLDQIMCLLLRKTSVRLQKNWGRYKWSLIESQTHYYQVYRYIYQNPLRAKICIRVEDYQFSSLKDVPFPLHTFIPMSFGGARGELLWLNERFDLEDQELIKLGLKKFQFDVSQRKLKAFNKLSLPRSFSRDEEKD